MSVIECAGKTIELDDDGFLSKLEDWNEDVAQELARGKVWIPCLLNRWK